MGLEFPVVIISALLIGLIIGRFSYSNRSSKNQGPDLHYCSESYIKGLNYLLSNKSDKAIQLFIDLIKVDSETIETHLALGNLFRTKGEVDRAIKIHQNLIARPNLTQNQRVMALSELAEDYLKAGLLDRAENLYKELVQINPDNIAAQSKLLELFTLEKSWNDALVVAQILFNLGVENSRLVLTHCYCEVAEQYLKEGNLKEARECLNKAIKIDDKCIRASLLLIDTFLRSHQLVKATRLLKQQIKSYPQMIAVFIKPAREIFLKHGTSQQYEQFLTEQYEKSPVTRLALELLEMYQAAEKHEVLTLLLNKAIKHTASLELYNFAFQYFKTRPNKMNEVWPVLTHEFQQIVNSRPSFLCSACGYESHALQWNCPSCRTWSSFKPI